MTIPLRIVFDVNFYVRLIKNRIQQRTGTAVQQVFSAIESGHVCGRPVQIVASYKMLDTMIGVLERLSIPAAIADQFERAIIDAMMAGPEELHPHMVLGGTPDLRVHDVEDGAILAAAYAARAHLLVTDNLTDFMPERCEIFETAILASPDGSQRSLTCQIIRRQGTHELVVAHPIDLAAWLRDQMPLTPENIRQRLAPTRIGHGG